MNISSTTKNIIVKSVGALGAGIVLCDAHHWGKLKSSDYRRVQDANVNFRLFNNTQYNTNQSFVTSKMRKSMFRMGLADRLRGDVNSVLGYLGGVGSSIIDSAVPAIASTVALVGKGKTAKIGAGVLCGWGVLSFLRHGISHTRDI